MCFQIESEMKRLLNIISEDQETILQKEKQVWKMETSNMIYGPIIAKHFLRPLPELNHFLLLSPDHTDSWMS